MTSQISSLEAVNTAIREKLTVLDRLKLEGLSGAAPNGEVAQMTVKTILESLSAELNTEVCFTSHLNQLVDKLNKRRSEQDQQITQLSTNLRDTEARVLKLEGEKTELLSKLERTLSELSRKDGASSTTNEVIHNLQQAVESKQSKIEEQKSTQFIVDSIHNTFI